MNYKNKAEKIINKYHSFKLRNLENDNALKLNNLYVGANLYNFLPQIDYNLYNDIHKGILINQALTEIEQFEIRLSEKICLNKKFEKEYKSTIFCTYHFASYRLICQQLMYQNISFSLVIAGKVFNKQGKYYHSIFNQIKNKYNTKSTFKIINAETRNGLIEMIKVLKMGGNLLFYIDGNTGVKENLKNLIEINLLNNIMLSRKGIAYLSVLTNSKIIPIYANRIELTEHKITICEEIDPIKYSEEKDKLKIITQKIYNVLEEQLIQKPEHWECWLYLHEFLDVKNLKINKIDNEMSRINYNYPRYITEKIKEEYYLFDRLTYTFTPISSDFNSKFKSNDTNYSSEFISRLISKKIIV